MSKFNVFCPQQATLGMLPLDLPGINILHAPSSTIVFSNVLYLSYDIQMLILRQLLY